MSTSSSRCFSPPRVLNSSGTLSSTSFFHSAIWVGCTPYSEAISFAVFIPRIASRATFALKSTLYCFRCTGMFVPPSHTFPIQLFYLIDLPRKLVHRHFSCSTIGLLVLRQEKQSNMLDKSLLEMRCFFFRMLPFLLP